MAQEGGAAAHPWTDRPSYEELVNEMDAAMHFPGTTNAWTMPIKKPDRHADDRHSDPDRHQGIRSGP